MKKLLLCSLLALLLASTGTVPAFAMTIEEFRVKVREFVDGKIENDAFLQLCNDALAKDVGDNAEYKGFVYAMRGRVYFNKRDIKKTLAEAELSIATNPKTTAGRELLVNALRVQNNFEAAISQANIIAEQESDPENKTFYTKMAENLRLEANIPSLTPAALWEAFSANEIAAEEAYKGKMMIIRGEISSITNSPSGDPQVIFASPLIYTDDSGNSKVSLVSERHIICLFTKDDKPQIAKLKKGQKISIRGACGGQQRENIFLSFSQLIE